MKRFFTFFLTMGLAVSAWAQVPAELSRFYEKIRTHCVSVDYSYTVETQGTKVNGSGRADIQGKCYEMTMNGIGLVSDGATLWMKDASAEEMVIDVIDPSTSQLLENPILFVTGIESLFELSLAEGAFAVPSREFTVPSMKVVMLPKGDEEVLSVDVHYAPDFETIVGAVLYMEDGTVTFITIPSMSFKALQPADRFKADTADLPENWIITDLR